MSSVLCHARRNAIRCGHPLVRLGVLEEHHPRQDINLFNADLFCPCPLPHDLELFVCY